VLRRGIRGQFNDIWKAIVSLYDGVNKVRSNRKPDICEVAPLLSKIDQ
jgi:hypothetical protein